MIRTIVIATFLTLPGLAVAQSTCADKHQAQNCATGTMWNAETQKCEQMVSS